MTRSSLRWTIAIFVFLAPAIHAQQTFSIRTPPVDVAFGGPFDGGRVVTGAPFSAEATTEFVQILGDGNRIEQRFSTSMARDSRGRTRHEQEIALIGPLGAGQATPPRIVTITDPEALTQYTLNQEEKTAVTTGRAAMGVAMLQELATLHATGVVKEGSGGTAGVRTMIVGQQVLSGPLMQPAVALPAVGWTNAVTPPETKSESLGTQRLEGVEAEGVRTTVTIPAGALGNVGPIDIVTERWFSKELQIALLVSRSDPRSGTTVYRVTSIVRAEPPNELFVVPPDYQLREERGPITVRKGVLRK